LVEASLDVHTRQFLVVEGGRAGPRERRDIALVQGQCYHTVYVLLALGHGGHQELHLRAEPEAVVHQLRHFRDQHVSEPHDLPVHGNGLEVYMGCPQNRSTRCFIYTARFDSDEPVFNHIHTTDGVCAADFA